MAILGIDHVIVIGTDLDVLAAQFGALGFTVTPGGRHPRATHNALIPLADGAYIELIAFWEPAPESRRWPMLQAGAGLCEFMLGSDDLDTDVAAAKARGAAYGASSNGARTRPDGVAVAWKAGPAPAGSALPYLIQDVTDRSARVPDGEPRNHANGVRGVARLILAVADLDRAARDYAALLGCHPEPLDAPGGIARAATFTAGSHVIELHQPRAGGEMADHIEARGDSPYAVVFRGDRNMDIDATAAGGARISISSD